MVYVPQALKRIGSAEGIGAPVQPALARWPPKAEAGLNVYW